MRPLLAVGNGEQPLLAIALCSEWIDESEAGIWPADLPTCHNWLSRGRIRGHSCFALYPSLSKGSLVSGQLRRDEHRRA